MTHYSFRTIQLNPQQSKMATPPLFQLLSKRSFRLSLFIFLVFFGIGYLLLSNHVATQGFQLKELETSIQSLKEKNASLEVKAMELNSLSNVADASKEFNLITIQSMEFIGEDGQPFAYENE